jgi:hypothetical protein
MKKYLFTISYYCIVPEFHFVRGVGENYHSCEIQAFDEHPEIVGHL